MKFVHIADIHFDTPFTTLSDKGNLGEKRRLEQRKIFKKVINYIKENDIEFLFISGDLYDQQYIRQSTIEYINNLFKEIENTKIFISPGNHDPYLKNSYYCNYNWNKNVYIFKSKIDKVELEEVNIYGFGFDDFYCSKMNLEEIKIENKEKINIFLVHGTLDACLTDLKDYNPISSAQLQKIGFDYVALGHIHKNNFIPNGKIIYPGSTISLGFDELGKHGMITGEIKKDKNELEFIELDETKFVEAELNCTDINSVEQLIEKINEIELVENKLYKIILSGKRNFEINIYDLYKYELNQKIIKIKDQTKPNYDVEKISKENTLKGLFVKEVIEEMKKLNYDEQTIEKALEIGMEILDKE